MFLVFRLARQEFFCQLLSVKNFLV